MNNITLFFRSLIIITCLVGFAHFFSYTKPENKSEIVVEKSISTDVPKTSVDTMISSPKQVEKINSPTSKQKAKPSGYNSDTDYIIGKWKVSYNSDEFTGAIIYDLKKEGNTFNAYTFQYEDENGHSQKAEGTKTLTIQEFDGYQGIGTYWLEYEGERYDVTCQIDMVDENTFKLSYDYHGYGDVETWKRF